MDGSVLRRIRLMVPWNEKNYNSRMIAYAKEEKLVKLTKLYITKRRHRQAGLLPYQRLYVSCGLSEKSKGVTRALCRVIANHELYSDKFVISVVNLN